MAVQVVVRVVRLALGFLERPRLRDEGRADRRGAGGCLDAGLEMGIDLAKIPASRRRFHGEALERRVIQQDLQLVGSVQSFHLLVAVAAETQLHFILARHGKMVGDQHAAAGALGQAFDLRLLTEVRRHPDDPPGRRRRRDPRGEAADLLCRLDVAVQQRRGDRAQRDVVEALARFVRRQEFFDIDLNAEQVADGVAVFETGEPPDAVAVAGIGSCRGLRVEPGAEAGDRVVVGLRIRARLVRRRHLARGQAEDDFFPDLRMGGKSVLEGRLKVQPALFRRAVVAVDAELVHQRREVRRLLRRGPGEGQQRAEQEPGGSRSHGGGRDPEDSWNPGKAWPDRYAGHAGNFPGGWMTRAAARKSAITHDFCLFGKKLNICPCFGNFKVPLKYE